MRKILHRLVLSLIITIFLTSDYVKAAVVIDHKSVENFNSIPTQWVTSAKSNLKIAYGHTSHGSQIVTGMNMLSSQNSLYNYTTGTNGFLCDSCMSGASDLGNPDRTAWATATRNYLNGPGSNTDVIIWSWCGQVSDATYPDIANSYLANMNQLEQEFPNVEFVYMTGHLDGTGEEGNLKLRNQQIRAYVNANNKILFDFADIESYDPDGTYYPDETDACGWCETWCESHNCPDCDSCAHSHCFNCYNKGKAFWYMAAVLAGWDEKDSSDMDNDDESDENLQINVVGNCFIATTAYGSASDPRVRILRQFRDAYLMPTGPGRAFVRFYYKYSPSLAEIIADHNSLKILARWGLAPVVGVAYIGLHTNIMQKIVLTSLILILVLGCFFSAGKKKSP